MPITHASDQLRAATPSAAFPQTTATASPNPQVSPNVAAGRLKTDFDDSAAAVDAALAQTVVQETAAGMRAPGPHGPAVALEICHAVRDHLGTERFARYFSAPWSMNAGGWLEVPVASAMLAQLCQQHFMPVVSRAASEKLGLTGLDVRFVVATASQVQAGGGADAASSQGLHTSKLAGQTPVPSSGPGAAFPGESSADTRGGNPTSAGQTATSSPNSAGRQAGRGKGESRAELRAAPVPSRHIAAPSNVPTSRYRIDQLVVGPGNRLAVDAVTRIGLRSGEGLSIVAVYGPCGVGKTHLLHGAIEAIKQSRPGAVARLITGETFVNEFLAALRGKSVETFRRALRQVELLCIDDLDFLAGKSASQMELQHCIDAIIAKGGAIVVSCGQHPAKVAGLAPALASRLAGGLCAPIAPPDDQTLQRLVRVLAARRGLVVEEQAIPTIMAAAAPSGQPANIRELEGVLTKIDAVARLLDAQPSRGGSSSGQRVVGLVCVQKAVGSTAPRDARRAVRMEEIIRTICFELSVSQSELGASGRHPRVVLARALCTALARRLTDQSYPEIARAIGRPNHSTVITAHQRLTAQIEACLTVDAGPRHGSLEVGLLLERLVRMLSTGL